MVSERERVSHVIRRLGFGSQPELIDNATTTDHAVALALDLSAEPISVPVLEPPTNIEAARDQTETRTIVGHWLEQLATSPRRIEERLVWFWHDHFATDIRKVKVPYLMYQQHLTVRQYATRSFADMLHAITIDPAMLIYLDGIHNASDSINENYGREVMELFTLGRGNYTEDDVVAASRAFSGWIVLRPEGRAVRFIDGDPWSSQFVAMRHDSGQKTLLGSTGPLDAVSAIDILLEQDRLAHHISGKLFNELVGWWPDPDVTNRIAAEFRRDYLIMDLVEAIVSDSAFLSDEAVAAKVRSPLEKAVGVAQAFGFNARNGRGLENTLRTMSYVPFLPPNVAGFPKGLGLLDPHRLIHTFDFSAMVPDSVGDLTSTQIMNSLGVFDISASTLDVLESVADAGGRIALAINSPEYHLV